MVTIVVMMTLKRHLINCGVLGPDQEVRGDSPDWNGSDPPILRIIWANPE